MSNFSEIENMCISQVAFSYMENSDSNQWIPKNKKRKPFSKVLEGQFSYLKVCINCSGRVETKFPK